MGWLTRDEHQELAAVVAKAVSTAVERISLQGGPIIVIGKMDIRINYAQGGGATVNVRER